MNTGRRNAFAEAHREVQENRTGSVRITHSPDLVRLLKGLLFEADSRFESAAWVSQTQRERHGKMAEAEGLMLAANRLATWIDQHGDREALETLLEERKTTP
jgi:hypothetical protein